jgi:hypothetical protein
LTQTDKEALFNRYVVTNEQWFLLYSGLCEAQAIPSPDGLLQAHITSLKTDLARLANERDELFRGLDAFPSVPETKVKAQARLDA